MPLLNEAERASLSIRRMVFHVVGGGTDPRLLNEPPRQATTDEFFLERIREHYDGILFDLLPSSPVHNCIRSMLNDETRFLRESKRLALKFHAKRGSAKASLFMVFLLDHANGSCVALLKYDQQQVVRARYASRGKKTALASIQDALVREKAAVEKAAIVRLDGSNAAEAAVHDRSDRAQITTYFKDFLSAKRRHTPSSLTQHVFAVFREVANKHLDSVPIDNRNGLNRRIAETLRATELFDPSDPHVVIGQIFGPLDADNPIPPAIASEFDKRQLTTEPFVIQREVISRPRARKVQTVEGISIRYPEESERYVMISDDKKIVTITSGSPVQEDDEPRPLNRIAAEVRPNAPVQ